MIVIEGVIGWLDLVATIVLAGGIFYSSLVAFPAPLGRRVLRRSVWISAAALVFEIAANSFRMHQVSGIGGFALVADVSEMKWSRLWLARAAGLAMIGMGMRLPRASWHVLSLIALGWLLMRSLQGHAGAHGAVAACVDWAHLSFAAAWLGGLTQFLLSPTVERRAAALRVRRLATIGAAAVVPSGIYAALLHIPDWRALVVTAYGRVLLGKLACVVVLLLLGALNHFLHVPRVGRGDSDAAARLVRTVSVEIVIGALILMLTAFLGQLPMPHRMGQ